MSSGRRIAQFVESLAAGGAEKLAVDIANALAMRGHETHLIVLDGDGPFRDRVAGDVRFHDLQRPRPTGAAPARLLDFLGTSRRLNALLRRERVEVVQTHLPKANFLGLAAALGHAGRVHPTVHNTREFDYGDDSGPLRTRLRKAAYRMMLGRCGTMIAVSAAVRSGMVAELGVGPARADRITVVDNGVPVPEPTTPDRRAAARRERGLGPDEFVLAGVGRLTRQKDFASLIEALAGVADMLPPWRCVIAGEGELRSDLEAAVAAAGLADRVALPGIDRDVAGLQRAADVFCLPSLYEGLPLALMEAMAAGLPVCAYDIDGTRELVADGVEGLLAPPRDARTFGENLVRLAGSPDLRMRLGRAARERILAHHDFRQVVDKLEEVLVRDR